MGRLLGSVFLNAVLLIKRLCNICIKSAEISAFINSEKSPVMHNLPITLLVVKKGDCCLLIVKNTSSAHIEIELSARPVGSLELNFLHALLGLSNWVYSFNLEKLWNNIFKVFITN
jgi:hypothetical protein